MVPSGADHGDDGPRVSGPAFARRHPHRWRQQLRQRLAARGGEAAAHRRPLPRYRHLRRHLGPEGGLLPDGRRRSASAFARVEPIFATLAPPGGYAYVGPPARATTPRWSTTASSTGCSRLTPRASTSCKAATEYDYDLRQRRALWNHGSVVRSWLLELAASSPSERRRSSDTCKAYVDDSGEGPLDRHGSGRARRDVVGALAGAVRALQLARRERLLHAGDRGASQRVRRTRGEDRNESRTAPRTRTSSSSVRPGDLAKRKLLPALYNLYLAGLLPEKGRIIGFARSPSTMRTFRELAAAAIGEFSDSPARRAPKAGARSRSDSAFCGGSEGFAGVKARCTQPAA